MMTMKRVVLLFAALLLLLLADAARHGMVEKKHERRLGQGFISGRNPKSGVFGSANDPESDDDDAPADQVGANNNDSDDDDDDDENLAYKNYRKGSDTETHRYFSNDKPYRQP